MTRNEAIAALAQCGTSLLTVNPSHICDYWVYSVHNDKGEVIYVGYDLLVDVANFTKLRTDPAFDMGKTYSVVIVDRGETVAVAGLKANEYRRALCGLDMPVHNMTMKINRRNAVQCDQTGVVYKNAAECARVLGLHTSNLCHHLNRKPGHRSLKGMTFTYVGYYAKDKDGRINFREKAK